MLLESLLNHADRGQSICCSTPLISQTLAFSCVSCLALHQQKGLARSLGQLLHRPGHLIYRMQSVKSMFVEQFGNVTSCKQILAWLHILARKDSMVSLLS